MGTLIDNRRSWKSVWGFSWRRKGKRGKKAYGRFREYVEGICQRSPAERISDWMNLMTAGAIEQKHGDLKKSVSFLRTRQRPGTKKPDASHTYCVKVQPRTCSRDAQRNAQQDTKIQSSCAGISISRAKEFKKLGWFSHNFAEITDERSSTAGPAMYESPFMSINISSNLEKVKQFSTKNR